MSACCPVACMGAAAGRPAIGSASSWQMLAACKSTARGEGADEQAGCGAWRSLAAITCQQHRQASLLHMVHALLRGQV